MQDFGELVQVWQTFYATIAASSATLVGLLFVALTLNPETVNLSENSALKLLSRQIFTTFLYVIGVALTFLIPDQTRLGLGLPLVLIAVGGLVITLTELRGVQMKETHAIYQTLLRRNRFKLAGFGLMIVIGLLVLFGSDNGILYWMVTPVLFLLFSASLNTWSLFVEVYDRSPKK